LSSPSQLTVLSIAHNAVAASNRRRIDALRAVDGVRVELLTPAWWHEEGRRIDVAPDADWHVGTTLATGNGTRYVYLTHLAGLIRRLQPDIIDLFEEPFSLVAAQTLLLRDAFAPHAALVFYSAVNVYRQWRLPYRLIERVLLRRADAAHAPNSDVPRILRARGMQHQPVATIPLGVDVHRFSGAESLVLEAPRPRVGFIGRLEPVKGLDVLLEAFSRLQSPASLLIVGDGPERARLVEQASLDPRVRWLPAMPFEAIPSVLKSFDVLVLPSVTIPPAHKEQFGRVLVEAMAAGVPVVGSDSGAIPEVIGDAGLVVPERDPPALAAALARVLSDTALRQDLVGRGRARAKNCFDWPVVAAQTLELFEHALAYRRNTRQAHAAVRA
jgi:glycosyltransferase involved in cell wall biosynthesis